MMMLDAWPEGVAANDFAVDRSVLTAISRGKANVERDLIALFRRLNDEDVAGLLNAVSDGDLPGATNLSHRICGSSRMIGAIGLATVCKGLESAGHASDLNTMMANMPVLLHEVALVNACLDSNWLAK